MSRKNGKMPPMRVTLDAAGRLGIPRKIRQEAGLRSGMPLEIRWREGCIEIKPASLPVKLERRGRLLVAIPRRRVSSLTRETVERTRRALQRERLSHS